ERDATRLHEIQATKLLDSASTPLFRASLTAKGKLIIIAYVAPDGTTLRKMVLQDALFFNYVPGAGTGQPPKDSFTINFTTMTCEQSKKSHNTTPHKKNQLTTWAS